VPALTGQLYREILLPKWEAVRWVAMQLDGWVFRGQRSSNWTLSTTFERGAKRYGLSAEFYGLKENQIIEAFQRRAHQFSDEGVRADELLEWVALIQHHGGPSRLLDFSHSFYVAAFFALADAERDEEAALWAVPADSLYELRRRKFAHLYDSGRDRGGSESLFGEIVAGVVKGVAADELLAIPFEPQRMNRRLAVQQGIFIAPIRLNRSFEQNLFGSFGDKPPTSTQRRRRREVYAGSNMTFERQAIIKLVLPPEIRDEALIDLRRMNISYASLFPDLEGFGRSLYSYFTPDWVSWTTG
jgi:hypothetical protein